MSLLWAVPAVSMAVAVALVLAHLRGIEQASVGVLDAVRRTGELRPPLAELRRDLNRSGPLVDRVWAHWSDEDRPGEGTTT
jgi:hypothetical protein